MRVHACLARSGPTPTVPGDTFDCPDCRAVLLESFREPATVPENVPGPPVPPAFQRPESGCLEPELCTTADPCPVCDPDEPDEPGLTGHETRTAIHPSRVQEGWGFWYASCSCGWKRSGVYGPPAESGQPLPIAWRAVGPEKAQQMADRWAEHHKQNPIKEPDRAVPEHRVDHGVGTHPDGVSGTWIVSCMSPGCGFVREGFYGPLYDINAPGVCRDRRHAYQACQRWINHHQQNPEEK